MDVPLDLREITDWPNALRQLEAQFAGTCSYVAANEDLNKHGMSTESCIAGLTDQVDLFVGGVCNRQSSSIRPVPAGASASSASALAADERRARAADPRCVNPTPFDALCRLKGTDKSSLLHGFASFYDRQLLRLRAPPAAILEVGVLRGASLGAWAAKFPCADVVGLDAFVLDDEPGVLYPGRYTVLKADQEDPASLLSATAHRSFDIVVDDGGHTMLQQQNTLQALWPKVRPCGLFIMEDLHTSYGHARRMYRDYSPTTLDIITGRVAPNASPLVDYSKVLSEAVSVELFHPSEDHVTAVIHKKC